MKHDKNICKWYIYIYIIINFAENHFNKEIFIISLKMYVSITIIWFEDLRYKERSFYTNI